MGSDLSNGICDVGRGSSDGANETIALISGGNTGNNLEIQLVIERRIVDGEYLSVQLDLSLPNVSIEIPSDALPPIRHLICGFNYLLAKDRTFKDPLKSKQLTNTNLDSIVSDNLVVVTAPSDENQNIDENTNSKTVIQKSLLDDDESLSDEDGEIDNKDAADCIKSGDKSQESNTFERKQKTDDVDERPVIVLPNGFVIHDRISISLSVHQASVEGIYTPPQDGRVRIDAKGFVTEIIWPKITQVCSLLRINDLNSIQIGSKTTTNALILFLLVQGRLSTEFIILCNNNRTTL
jgi:hypothetical protein